MHRTNIFRIVIVGCLIIPLIEINPIIASFAEDVDGDGKEDEGCTLNFWKKNTNKWPEQYRPATQFDSVFGFEIPGKPDLTLGEALKSKQGDLGKMLRQGVGALLNAAFQDGDLAYPHSMSTVIRNVEDGLDPKFIQSSKYVNDNDFKTRFSALKDANDSHCPLFSSFSFTDNFDDDKISNKWAVTTSTGLTVIENGGLLELSGSSTYPLSIAQVEKNKLLTAGPSAKATVETQIRLGGGAQDFGSTARIVLFKDSDNFLVFGMVDPGGVYYQRKQGADTLTQTVLSIPRDTQFHDYRIQYDGNQAKLYFDGYGVATVDIELNTFKVWLQGHTNHLGPGAVLGEFDRFELSAPLPG
jgi:hypothetical protein